MKPKPPACSQCSAFTTGQSFVPGVGPTTAKVALVGQGPGKVEAWSGVPFVGPSGHVLDRWLSEAAIRRKDVFISNVVQCWLPGDRAPTKKERDYCTRAHLFPELAKLPNLKVIHPVGVPATKVFCGEAAGETSFCTLFEKEFDFAASSNGPTILGDGPTETPDGWVRPDAGGPPNSSAVQTPSDPGRLLESEDGSGAEGGGALQPTLPFGTEPLP